MEETKTKTLTKKISIEKITEDNKNNIIKKSAKF